jgi:superfamily II DNA or RNA helicase
MLVLRPYQVNLTEQARASLRGGCRRLLIQSATGSGKTVLIANLLARAAAKGKRSWFCVHRKELLDQAVQTFVDAADIHTGIVAAGYPMDPSAPVQVCSVGSLKKRLSKLQPPDLIVFDECHHVPSASWSSIAQAVPKAHQIGLTATPQRLDGKGLGAFFDALILGPSVADLIAQGYLSPYRLFAPGTVDTSQIHRVAGDFNKAEVATAMSASTVVGDAVDTYRKHAEAGRALVFVWSLKASRALAAAFTDAGITAAHVDGETPKDERKRAMDAFRAGDLRVICNVDLFGEGLDVPAVDAVFLLRPTESLGLYLQQCGRGLRPSPGKASVRIFDHVGNWTRHGLPDEDRAWSLEGRPKKPKDAPCGRRCPECFAVSPAGSSECEECGSEFPVKARKIQQVAGKLVEADLTALRSQAKLLERGCRTLQDWQNLARRLGYKPGWGFYRWTAQKGRSYAAR